MLNVALMSPQRLKLDLLARSYESLGNIELSDNRIKVEWDEGWFWIDVDSIGDEYFLDADYKELSKVYKAIGRPQLAELRHSDFVALDLAIINFPCQEGIFLDNSGLSIFSLEEVKQRIEHRVEWVDVDGFPQGVDLVLHAPNDDGLVLVFLADDALGDVERSEELYRRLRLCLEDIASRRLRLPRGDVSEMRKAIEFVYMHSPVESVKRTEISRENLPRNTMLPPQILNEVQFRERHGFVPRDLPSLRDRY